MRLFLLVTFGLLVLSTISNAQTIYKKTIEITDGNKPTVLIKTESNGKVTEERLEGEAARKYIKDGERKSDKIIDLEITKSDINALDQELQLLMQNIEKRVIEFNETPMDTNIQRMNKRIEKTSKCIKKEVCGAL